MDIIAVGSEAVVAPGLNGYTTVDVRAAVHPYGLTATVTPDGTGKLIVAALTVRQVDGGQPIQRGELAKLSMQPLIRYVADETVSPQPPGPSEIDPVDLEALAATYRWIRLQEGKPTAVMAQEFGVSTPTVRRWVGKAVTAGYLTQSERTK